MHDITLTFYGLYQHLANHYGLDNFVSGRPNFMYASYGERSSDKKSKFLSGNGKIEYHWVRENILEREQALNFSDLDLQVENIKVGKGDQDISCGYKFMCGMKDELGCES